MKLAWGAKVTNAFKQKIMHICYVFNWTDEHASWLMACMAFESAETFSPSIPNKAGSGAVGLIQFMPTTAIGLGTTTAELATMTDLQQLRYVQKYFAPYHKEIKTLSDMYAAIFAPKYVGYSEDTTLYSEGSAYRLNAPLDRDKDGKITKREASYFVEAKLIKGMQYGYWSEEESVQSNVAGALNLLRKARECIDAAEELLR